MSFIDKVGLALAYRIVESVGEGVRDMKEGDHVVPIFNGECGDCIYCKREKTNMCERSGVNPFKTVMVSDGKSRFSTLEDGKPIFHFLNTSTFSEYTVLESACVVKVDPAAPLKKMTLLSCGVSTGKRLAPQPLIFRSRGKKTYFSSTIATSQTVELLLLIL